MFIVGMVYGINPNLLNNSITLSAPGGYVFILNFASLTAGLCGIVIGLSFIGIKVLGSGLSDTTVSIINRAVVYFLMWAILSITTLGFLGLIPTFGYIIYGIISILYAFGVFQTLSTIGGADSPAGGTGGSSEE